MIICKKVFDAKTSDGNSKDAIAFGADVVTAVIVSVKSTGGTSSLQLQGSIDGITYANLGSASVITTSTTTVIVHSAASGGVFRHYRLTMSSTSGTISITAWITAIGHERANTEDL